MTPLDDELRDLLEARATRGAIDLEALAVEGRRRALAAPRESRRRAPLPAVMVTLGGVAALVAVVALVVVPLAFRPAASTGPSTLVAPTGGPSPTTIAPPPSAEAGPARVEAMTVQGLADWLATAGATANGRVVLLEGELITDSVDCIGSQPDCAPTVVRKAPTSIVIEPVGDIGPGPWDGSGPLAGTFALRGTDRTWARTAPVMEFLGMVRRADDQLAWRVSDLIPLAPADGPDGFLVAGWMVRTPFHPCPSPANPYDCPTSDLLTPERVQPTHADGSSELPEIALALPSGTYDEFAPDPAPEGPGVVPRPGYFLLQRVSIPPCGPYADCYVGPEHRHWIVRARLDPIEGTSPTLVPTPDDEGDHYPGGIPRAIDGEPVLVGLDAQARWQEATDDAAFLVGGWFDSHVLNTCSGGIGPHDPNPLAARGCPRYSVAGLPGRPVYPGESVMPDGDGPIVLRVHTNDPGAATCIPEYRQACQERLVVESVAWFGDAGTVAAPIGPVRARGIASSVFVMEWRDQPDGSQTAVGEDVFTVPIACPAPWPTLLFSVHGDPRYGLIAVFPDPGARERFEAGTDPVLGAKCLDLAIERPAGPRWVGRDNVLVLVFADDAFAARLSDVLEEPDRPQKALSMTEPGFDRTLGTVTDYLVVRAAGELDHAWAERLVDPFQEESALESRYLGWLADTERRATANALVGRLQAVEVEQPTEARVGPEAWRVLQDPGVSGRIIGVVYDGATDPALATEEYLVIHTPESQFRDWQLIRISGEPWPVVTTVIAPGGPPADPSTAPGSDGSHDVPCTPAGDECP